MKQKDIVNAWVRIRTIDHTIPDDVLDFMKDSAISALNPEALMRQLSAELGYTPLRLPKEGEPWDYESLCAIELSKGWDWVMIDNDKLVWRGQGVAPKWGPNTESDEVDGDWNWGMLGAACINWLASHNYTGHPKDSLRVKGGQNGNV